MKTLNPTFIVIAKNHKKGWFSNYWYFTLEPFDSKGLQINGRFVMPVTENTYYKYQIGEGVSFTYYEQRNGNYAPTPDDYSSFL